MIFWYLSLSSHFTFVFFFFFFFGFHFFVLFELVNMWIVKLRYLEMHKLLTFAHLVLASLMLKHFGFWGCLSLPFIVFCMFLKIFRNIHFLMHFCCFNDLVCWCLLIVQSGFTLQFIGSILDCVARLWKVLHLSVVTCLTLTFLI